jgi:hypothetical protein
MYLSESEKGTSLIPRTLRLFVMTLLILVLRSSEFSYAQVPLQKAQVPSECQITGRVEARGSQAVARIQVVFRFQVVQPRTLLNLGLLKGQLIEAKYDDGSLPLLSTTETGLQVQVEKPGEHALRLEVETLLTTRGGKPIEQVIDLGLPGCAITTLSFQTPEGVRRINVTRKEGTTTESRRFDASSLLPGREPLALGAISQLDLSWELPRKVEAVPEPRGLTSEWNISISESEIVSEAKLKLKGTQTEWRIFAPSTAEVLVQSLPTGSDSSTKAVEYPVAQAPRILRPEPDKPSIWRVQFSERVETTILVTITSRLPMNRPNDSSQRWTIPLGPFAVLDIPMQSGTIRVRAPSSLRVLGNLRGDTRRLESADDSLLFRFGLLPAGMNGLPGSPVELELRPLPSAVQTRINHQLQRVDRGWRIRSDMQITPIRAEVEQLEIDVPIVGDFQNLVVLPLDLVEGLQPLREQNGRRFIQVRLAQPKREPFLMTVEGFYPVPLASTEASFGLPRVASNFDRGGQVEVTWNDERELRGGLRETEGGFAEVPTIPIKLVGANQFVGVAVRSPAQIDLSWSRPRPLLKVETSIDCICTENQALIEHRFDYRFVDRMTRQWTLRLAPGSASPRGIQVSEGSLQSSGSDEWTWTLPSNLMKEGKLQVTSLASVEIGKNRLPLFSIEEAATENRRVTCWNDATNAHPWNFSLLAANQEWIREPSQFVAGKNLLPGLIARSFVPFAPFDFELTPGVIFAEGEGARAWIERGLVQWHRGESVDRYRWRVWVRPNGTNELNFELPLTVLEASCWLDSRKIPINSQGANRISLPTNAEGNGLFLELRYQLPTTAEDYYPRGISPRFRNLAATGPIRWSISQSGTRLMLFVGQSGRVEEDLGWREGKPGWFPRYSSPELEVWLKSGAILDEAIGEFNQRGELLLRQSTLEGPRLLIIGPILMVVVFSTALFFLGWILISSPWRISLALLIMVLGFNGYLAIRVPAIFHWAWLASLPGFALLFALAISFGVVQWRYHRRLTFLPSFSRGPTESSIARLPGSSNRAPNRDLSTTDAGSPEPWAGS